MIKFPKCERCIHKLPWKENSFMMRCEAFEDGIPFEFDLDNVENISECNNGFHYETIPNNDKIVISAEEARQYRLSRKSNEG